jgi:hypothetical protein
MQSSGQTTSAYILTEGGLTRTLKVGRPEQTMHLWWTGAFLPNGIHSFPGTGGPVEAGEFLIEIQLLRVEGDAAILRFCGPEQVRMVSAKKDPHRKAGGGSLDRPLDTTTGGRCSALSNSTMSGQGVRP